MSSSDKGAVRVAVCDVDTLLRPLRVSAMLVVRTFIPRRFYSFCSTLSFCNRSCAIFIISDRPVASSCSLLLCIRSLITGMMASVLSVS